MSKRKKEGVWWDHNVPYVSGCSGAGCPCSCWAKVLVRRFPVIHGVGEHSTPIPFSQVVVHPEALDKVLSYRKPRWLFWCLLGDLFDEQVEDYQVKAVAAVMAGTQIHTHVVVTKQHERLEEWAHECKRLLKVVPDLLLMSSAWDRHSIAAAAGSLASIKLDLGIKIGLHIEPLLAPPLAQGYGDAVGDLAMMDWIVVGADNSPGWRERPMDPRWARDVRDVATLAGVPFWLKSLGPGLGRELDGRTHDEKPLFWRTT